VRSYSQFCPAARALDLVGERWTLLLVRELLFGPKRYTDLQDGLPGIGPNVLAERLRSLESAGLIAKRRLPPPAASTVYELTELGMGLRSVLEALFRWGLQVIGTPTSRDKIKASYWLPAVKAAARADALPPGVKDTYEFRIDDEVVSMTATRGAIEVRQGASASPDLVLRTDAATFVALGRGDLSALGAIEDGKLTVHGDPAAAERCAAIFAMSDREPLGKSEQARR
jgi:DNA-binding HxlR family transcriptional regulator/putative sterol carrier protein